MSTNFTRPGVQTTAALGPLDKAFLLHECPESVYWTLFGDDMSMSLIGICLIMKGSWKTRTV
ncbi:hypothetical protein E3V39_09225 [Gammaproteobacteria bacterium LSUCC0112]|nr:hypothetical protein E3V39_09225 [Gammaproteobacteria bacterium LSUCC0112]